MLDFKYLSDENKPRDNDFGLSLQTKSDINKTRKQEEYINHTNFNWNDDMEKDKPLYLEMVKEQILDGNTKFRELYLNDTYAFLAPDNYGADSVDEIDISVDTQIQQASKEYDRVCKDIRNNFVWACQETNQLYLIDYTKGWKVRDFISEAQYQSEQFDQETNHKAFAMWRRVANIGVQILTDDMVCTIEHMSKYDKLN